MAATKSPPQAATNGSREAAPNGSRAQLVVCRGDLRAWIVESILQDILSGNYSAGEHLVTEHLAQRFQVSHTPIREAIGTLAGMGVLEVSANRGAVVRALSPEDIREVMYVRASLEAEAIRTACGRIPVDALRTLRKEFARLAKRTRRIGPADVAASKEADTELHALVREYTTNRFLRGELERLMAMVRVIRDAAWMRLSEQDDLSRVPGESKEHLDIVMALLRNSPDEAAAAMLEHLRAGAYYVSRAVDETVRPGGADAPMVFEAAGRQGRRPARSVPPSSERRSREVAAPPDNGRRSGGEKPRRQAKKRGTARTRRQ